MRLGGLFLLLLILFTGVFDLGTFLLFTGSMIDDSKTESPDVEATVDVIDIALLDEFDKFCKIVFGVDKVLFEGLERERSLEVVVGGVVWRLVHGKVYLMGRYY